MPTIVPTTPRLAFQATILTQELKVGVEHTKTILDHFVYQPVIDRLQREGYAAASVESVQPALLVARQHDVPRGVTLFRTVFPTFLALPPGWASQGWRAYSGVLATIDALMVDGPMDGMECTVQTDSNIVELPMPEGHDTVDDELYQLLAPAERVDLQRKQDEATAPPLASMSTATYYRAGYDLEARRWAYSVRPLAYLKEAPGA